MEKGLQKTWSDAKYHPELKLSDDIWQAIISAQERQARTQALLYGFLGLFSFAALFPVISDMLSRFTQSGFYEYASLAFSDSSMVASAWKEFALSIADSLPATSILLSAALLFVVLFSFKRAARRFTSSFTITA